MAAVAAEVEADVDACAAVVRPVAEAARVGVPASAKWPAIATVATALAAAAAMRDRRAG